MPDLSNTAEGGSEDAAVTAANSGGASGNAFNAVTVGGAGAITYDNEHVAHGNRAFKIVGDVTSLVYMTWTSSLGTVPEAWGRLYLYLTGVPGGIIGIVRLRSGGAQVARITVSAGAQIQLRNSSNATTATVGTAVATGQWTRIEWHCLALASSGDLEVRLHNDADSSTPTDSASDTAMALLDNLDEVHMGHHNVSPASTIWMDDLQVNTTGWPGPALVSSPHLLRGRQRPPTAAMQRAAFR